MKLKFTQCMQVEAMSGEAALRFVGVDPKRYVAVDLGPTRYPERSKPGARTWGIFEATKAPN